MKLINDGTLTAKKTSLDAEQGPFGMCKIFGVYEDQKWEGGKETSDAWKKQQRAMGRYLYVLFHQARGISNDFVRNIHLIQKVNRCLARYL